METPNGTFEVLPIDYNNWSSLVILFLENYEDINVYAFDYDDCNLYYVVSYKRPRHLFRCMGYTAGNFNVYFVGEDNDEQFNPIDYSHEVRVYDIRNRVWLEDFPKLKAPKPRPFVFFLNGLLYVLSTGISYKEPHFEMLDINNISRGWVSLSNPSFVSNHVIPANHAQVIDYSKKMLYVRLIDWSYCDCYSNLYGYSVHDHKRHIFRMSEENITSSNSHVLESPNQSEYDDESSPLTYDDVEPTSSNIPVSESSNQSKYDDELSLLTYDDVEPSPLTARTGNLLKASWSNGCVIVDNHLYRFQIFLYPKEERRAILIVRDLEHEIEVHNNAVELDYVDSMHFPDDPPIGGCWEVDISHVVHEDVLQDMYSYGNLVYLGKRNSCLRFSLVIWYTCRSGYHVCTCTFDLELKRDKAAEVGESSTVSFIAKPISCKSHDIVVDTFMFSCKELCEVKDN
ncbi:hypothetical protein A4A49_07828 [Nicotiana attenuata]|uniref:Uncharacterized protein n=1 Tax=Nicotiana attenuata TaxID=49451 RepID=A0A1J6JAT9_NICAT|nr:hypothetical protein A4A49_07828 [Nicotiana attenuata]